MPSAYVARLNKEMLAAAAQPQPATPSLRQRVVDWYEGLPLVSRHRPFAMTELETALGTQGKYISPILLSLGWQRKRKWTGAGQYPRFWLPPQR